MINEYDKVRLKSGEIARISEVLESGAAYVAEIFRPNNGFSITIEDIRHDDIASVFIETETPLTQVLSESPAPLG